MTSKERMRRAARGELPDRVPVCPDAVFYLPMRLRYRTYNAADWPTPEDKLACMEHYGFEKVIAVAAPATPLVETESRSWSEGDAKYYRTVHHTRAGDLVYHMVHPADDAAWVVTNPADSVDQARALLDTINVEEDRETVAKLSAQVDELPDDVFINGIARDPLEVYCSWRGHQNGIMDLMDCPDEVQGLLDDILKLSLRQVRMSAQAGVDGIGIGSNGLSLLSPTTMRRFVFPYLKKITDEAHNAGLTVSSHHHGRLDAVLEDCANYGVDVLNPLERPPTGDIDLADAKQRIGHRVTLMGNVGTVTTLLTGTPDDVRNEVRECMEAAKDGGRFVLSTSDQIARDTPDENIRALVDAGLEFGRY